MAVASIMAISTIASGQGVGASAGDTGSRQLPAPTGEHGVGVRHFHWKDAARLELGISSSVAQRELIASLWYPARKDAGRVAPYFQQATLYADSGLISPRTRNLLGRVTHAAVRDASPAQSPRPFPLVVFSGGNGEMEFMYTAFAEELASHGVVVAVVAHPGVADVAYPDGRVLRRYARLFDPKPTGWDASVGPLPIGLKRALYDTMYTEAARYLTADVSFILDELALLDARRGDPLAGRLDLGRIATGGHSYGGNVAIDACARDARVKACFQFDGGAFGPVRDSGLTKPYMLLRPAFVNDATPRGVAQSQLFGSLESDGYEVNIAGATHRSFMDAHFIYPATRGDALDPGRVHAIVSAYVRAFLDHHLGGKDLALLRGRSPSFNEVYLRALRHDFPARSP